MILTGEAHQALGLWSERDIMCFGKRTNALSQIHTFNLSLLSWRFVTVGYYWLLVPIYQNTWCHIAEEHKLHIKCHKNPQISHNASSLKFNRSLVRYWTPRWPAALSTHRPCTSFVTQSHCFFSFQSTIL